MTGAIGWSPDQFWRSTMHEVADALEGYRLANDSDYAERKAFEKFKADVTHGRT